MTGMRNVRGGLILLSAGLLGGMLMSLYAFEPIIQPSAGLDQYNDVPRRLLRLAHIAAIMLPILNIAIGPWLDRLALSERARAFASHALLIGAVGVPAGLALQAIWEPARVLHLAGFPVVLFCAAVLVVSFGALRTPREAFLQNVAKAALPCEDQPRLRHPDLARRGS